MADSLGFHSLWVAEHHFWYDGWCPAALSAAAVVLGATDRLGVGTGVHLLPLWDLHTERSAVETLLRLAGPRLHLGVGLGYRDPEYAGLSIPRRLRAPIMDHALDRLLQSWESGNGPPLLVGGFSKPALQRAASRGIGSLLPFSMNRSQLVGAIEYYDEACVRAGRTRGQVAVMRYVKATDGTMRARHVAREEIGRTIREYTGAWFPLQGRTGFDAPKLLAEQLTRASDNALIGPPEQLITALAELAELGVDLVVLITTRDDLAFEHRDQMTILGEHVLPKVSAL